MLVFLISHVFSIIYLSGMGGGQGAYLLLFDLLKQNLNFGIVFQKRGARYQR